MYPENFDECYELTEGEIFFDEMKEKFKEVLKDDIKSELGKLRKENIELRAAVQEYNNKSKELNRLKREIQYKEGDLRREIERDFYNKTIDEVFERLLEDSEIWYTETIPHERPKCKLCNSERKLIATYPNGQTVSKDCECSNPEYYYEPVVSKNRLIKFYKTLRDESKGDKMAFFTTSYQPNRDYCDAYSCYGNFKIESVFGEFGDKVIDYHCNNREDGEKIGFRNKKACQEYCDWLNERKKN